MFNNFNWGVLEPFSKTRPSFHLQPSVKASTPPSSCRSKRRASRKADSSASCGRRLRSASTRSSGVGSNYVRKHPIKEWIRTLKKTRVCETTYSTAASSSWCSVVISALRKVHEWVERERMGVNLLPRRANSKPHESMSKTWNLASKS